MTEIEYRDGKRIVFTIMELVRRDNNFLLWMLVDNPAAVLAALEAAPGRRLDLKRLTPEQLTVPMAPPGFKQISKAGAAPPPVPQAANTPVPQQMLRGGEDDEQAQRTPGGAGSEGGREGAVKEAITAACKHEWVYGEPRWVGGAQIQSQTCSKCGKQETQYN